MCLGSKVFCYKCLSEVPRKDAERLSVQQYNNGKAIGLKRGWVCWFCLQEPSEPLAIACLVVYISKNREKSPLEQAWQNYEIVL